MTYDNFFAIANAKMLGVVLKQFQYRKVLEGWEAYLQTKSNWSPLMLEVIEDQRASALQLLLAAQLEEFDYGKGKGYLRWTN